MTTRISLAIFSIILFAEFIISGSVIACDDEPLFYAFPDKNHKQAAAEGRAKAAVWPDGSGRTIAAMMTLPIEEGPRRGDVTIYISILGKDCTRLASGHNTVNYILADILWLDLANYRLNQTERAFGVRLGRNYSSTAINISGNDLILYRYRDKRIEVIFHEEMSSDGIEWEDKSADRMYHRGENRSILIVDSATTNGFNDFIIKSTKVEFDPDNPWEDKVISRETTRTRFRWNGKQYMESEAK